MVWRFTGISFSFLLFFGFLNNTNAQETFDFKKKKIVILGHVVTVQVADTTRLRKRGLMHRKKNLGPDEGMLFIFEDSRPLSFWMKNTFIPLSIGFFDKNKKLLNVKNMSPESILVQEQQLKKYSSQGPAKYALEVDVDWFKKRKVPRGTPFSWL